MHHGHPGPGGGLKYLLLMLTPNPPDTKPNHESGLRASPEWPTVPSGQD